MSTDFGPDPLVDEAIRRGLVPSHDDLLAEARRRGLANDVTLASGARVPVGGNSTRLATSEPPPDARQRVVGAVQDLERQKQSDDFAETVRKSERNTNIRESADALKRVEARDDPVNRYLGAVGGAVKGGYNALADIADFPRAAVMGEDQKRFSGGTWNPADIVNLPMRAIGAAVAPVMSAPEMIPDPGEDASPLGAAARIARLPVTAPRAVTEGLTPYVGADVAEGLANVGMLGVGAAAHGYLRGAPEATTPTLASRPAALTASAEHPNLVEPRIVSDQPKTPVTPTPTEIAHGQADPVLAEAVKRGLVPVPQRGGTPGERGAVGDVGSSGMPKLDPFGPRAVGDRIIDTVEGGVKKLTVPLLDKIGESAVGRFAGKVRSAIEDTPEVKIGEGYVKAGERAKYGRNVGESQDAAQLKALKNAIRGTTPDQQAAVTDWGRQMKTAPDRPFPTGFSASQETAIRGALEHFSQKVRGEEVAAGSLSPEALAEYPRFLPRQYEEFADENAPKTQGAPTVRAYDTAHDAWGGRLKLPQSEVQKLIDAAGVDPDYFKTTLDADGNPETLLKFSDPQAWEDVKAQLDRYATGEARYAHRPTSLDKETRQFMLDTRNADRATPEPSFSGQELVKNEFSKMTPEEEEALRPVRDPSKLLESGMRRSRSRIQKSTFLNQLADVSDEKGKYVLDPLSAEATRAQRPENVAVGDSAGYEKLEGRGWGKLAGKLVRKDAAKALKDTFGEKGVALDDEARYRKIAFDVMKGANSVFKESHAVFNPALAARHVGATQAMMRLAGIEPFNPENWPRIVKALRDTAPEGKYGEEATGFGYRKGTGAYTAPEETMARESSKGWDGHRVGRAIASAGGTEGFGSAAVKKGYIGAKNAAARFSGLPYEGVQRSIYGIMRESGMEPEEAAAYVEKFTLHPADFSTATKVLSDVASPFLRFRAGIARIYAHAAYEHPVRVAMDRLATRALQAGIATAVGLSLTDDEKKVMDEEHPGEIATGRGKDGKLETLNLRYLDPAGDFYPGRHKIGEGLDTATGWRKYGERATGLGDNPTYDFIGSVKSGENRYGQPVEGVGGILKEAARTYAPSQAPGVGWEAQKIGAALKGEPATPNTQQQTPMQALLEQLGVRVGELDPQFEAGRIGREGYRIYGRGPQRGAMRRGEPVDADKASDAATEAQKRSAPLDRISTLIRELEQRRMRKP